VLLDPSPIGVPSLRELGLQAEGRCIVGLNVSGLLSADDGSFGKRTHFKTDYNSVIPKLIELLIRKHGAAVILVPHVFGDSWESDAAACERIYIELRDTYPGCLGLANGKYDQSQIKYLIGLCDFFVGSRMHACIAAVSQGVPAVSLAYSDKFIGVMETMGLRNLVADLRTQGESEVLAVVNSGLAEREDHRARLKMEMPGLRKSVLNVFAGVEIAAAQ
jgi:polysaccharide pyruvyl transferase WcaK-like protein